MVKITAYDDVWGVKSILEKNYLIFKCGDGVIFLRFVIGRDWDVKNVNECIMDKDWSPLHWVSPVFYVNMFALDFAYFKVALDSAKSEILWLPVFKMKFFS